MTCKDCICYDILCKDTLQDNELELCDSFKNKADFVEVVRCKKCKYRITHTCAITGIETLFCNYGEKPVAVEPTHFCGFGERRTDDDL